MTHLIHGQPLLDQFTGRFFFLHGWGALGRGYCLPGLAQAHPVALDTRLPASYGPGRQYPLPSFSETEYIYQKPLTHAFAHSLGFPTDQ
jgi:hypothetical protein